MANKLSHFEFVSLNFSHNIKSKFLLGERGLYFGIFKLYGEHQEGLYILEALK
jgi:hypothetical protein